MKPFLLAIVSTFVAVTSFGQAPSDRLLDLYFIDVEGGQATLIVLPGGQTLLVDAGYAGAGASGAAWACRGAAPIGSCANHAAGVDPRIAHPARHP